MFFLKRPQDVIAPESDAEDAAGGLEYRNTANGKSMGKRPGMYILALSKL